MSASFAARVEALRDSWAERRELSGFVGAHDFATQFALLGTLHAWSLAAAAEVSHVYGDSVRITASGPPDRSQGCPAFSLTIEERFAVRFALAQRRRLGESLWYVGVTLTSPGADREPSAAGPERRNGRWSRGRLEELLLALLSSYERARAVEDRAQAAPGDGT